MPPGNIEFLPFGFASKITAAGITATANIAAASGKKVPPRLMNIFFFHIISFLIIALLFEKAPAAVGANQVNYLSGSISVFNKFSS
jgi:hypothetical protein